MNEQLAPAFAPPHAFLRDFAPEQRASLAEGAQAFAAAANDLLAQEGKTADAFYLINSGHVAIELHRPGLAPARIQTVGPGEAVGWSWLFAPYQWEFDARALDAVAGVKFDAVWLRNQCDSDVGLGAALFKKLAGVIASRLTATRLQLLDLYR